jgi:NADPH:quinone reductase
MTKAFRLDRTGGPEVMQWEDVEVGEPGPGQVRLRHTAIGLNFREIYVRNGLHAVKLPSGLGLESAGVIDALGSDVSGFSIGQRVACVAGPDGAYAQARLVPAARVIPLPDDIDDRVAAAILLKGMTARYLVRETYPVKAGDTILIHAAAGGVGLIVCQWAKHLGATVIGTVSSKEKAATASAHGCDHPIVYSEESFVDRVRAITDGKGVNVVYDSVGKATFEGSLQCLRPRGLLASFGEASGDADPVPPRRLGQLGSIYLTHPSLPDYTASRDALMANANELFAMVHSGKVRATIGATYALVDAPRAHRDMEARATIGASLLIP